MSPYRPDPWEEAFAENERLRASRTGKDLRAMSKKHKQERRKHIRRQARRARKGKKSA